MLKKIFHLKSKEVNYLTKKRNYFSKGIFSFFYIPQYPNKQYHQCSFHVTIKLSKSAVWRNFVRRIIMKYLEENQRVLQDFQGKYFKFFININKNTLIPLQSFIEQRDKTSIKNYLLNEFQISFTSFQKFICKK
ncbi:ribonuclease P protein component [bacterium]|nr:ribonuclease P protein component [bacterium]